MSQSVTANKVTFAQLAQAMKNQNPGRPMQKHERHKRTITFKPQNNIVVTVERDGDIVKNDDDIRKAIGGLDSDITLLRELVEAVITASKSSVCNSAKKEW